MLMGEGFALRVVAADVETAINGALGERDREGEMTRESQANF